MDDREQTGLKFLICAFGLLSGILVFNKYEYVSLFVVFVLSSIALAFYILNKGYWIQILLLFSIFLLIGSLRASFLPEVSEIPEGKLSISGMVVEYPDRRDNRTEYVVSVDEIGGEKITNKTRVLVGADRFPEANFGDVISATGSLETPSIIEDENGKSFDYGAYLKSQGLSGRMSFAKVVITEEAKKSFRGMLFAIRQKFSSGIDRAFTEPQAGFLKGIILGEKHSAGKEIEEDFRNSGLSHLVVLSGYNVMIVVGSILFLFKYFSPRFAPYIAGLILLCFVLMTGAEETAIRAGLMASIMLLGLVLRKQYDALRALSIVIVVFALINPLSATSLSFLLSAVATFAVIFIAPRLIPRISFMTPKFGIREATATTIGAQLLVAPIILSSIGKIPILSLLANILVLPFMPLAMGLGAIGAFAGLINFIPEIISFPAHLVLSYVIFIAKAFGSIGLSIAIPYFLPIIAWLCYGGILWFYLRSSRKRVVSP